MSARIYDLSIMEGATAPGNVKITLSFGNQGMLVTGTQKASQFFTLAFLTERGTVLGDASFGTDFVTQARAGVIRSDPDVPLYFNLAARDILDYQAGNISLDTPDDEIIESLILMSYILRVQQLQIQVRLTTIAGDAREVILPIDAVPTG